MSPDLAALRGLHLPTGGGSALQAETVAAVAIGFALALLVGLVRLLRARRQASLRRTALHALTLTRALDPETRRLAQARLLRRLVRSLSGDAAASAHGSAWAANLDRTFATDFFTNGAGRSLTVGLYRPPTGADSPPIEDELRRLFARIRA